MAPDAVRYACMIFGLANVGGSIAYATQQNMFILICGLLVGGGWFAFGKYGGLPLVNTVADWRPSTSGAIEDMQRQGLRRAVGAHQLSLLPEPVPEVRSRLFYQICESGCPTSAD